MSPSNNAFSETFIQAHRALNGGKTVFYYGAVNSLRNEKSGYLTSVFKKIFWRVAGVVFKKQHFDISTSLKKSLVKNNVKLVLVEYGTFAAELLPHLLYTKIPFIVHFHGYDASSKSFLKKYAKIYKEVFLSAKFVVGVSRQMENKLLELGCPRSKLIYNVYGPNDIFFKTRPKYNGQNFLFTGRFVNKKAPYYLILSFEKIIKEFPNAKLIMVGDGPLLEVCQNIINTLNLNSNIFLVGRKEPAEILNYLDTSICYIQHSIVAQDGDTEGTPLSILEASAAALPVISTKHAGIPDVIIDNETGYLVDEHDVDSMSARIKHLLLNPELGVVMGKEARKNIKENFTIQRHLNLLDELIKR